MTIKSRFIKITILAGVLACLTLPAWTQPLGKVQGTTILRPPVAYIKPTGVLVPPGSDKVSEKIKQWVVFSDRDNNPTYQKPGGDVYREMKFMECFFVIKEVGEYLRVVRFNPFIINSKNKIVRDGEDYGYVHRDKVLLWEKAIVHHRTSFVIKALSVHQPEDLQPGVFKDKKKLQLYDTPTLSKGFENDNDVRLLEFLYIYKKNDINGDGITDAYLIGMKERIPRQESDRYMMGWIRAGEIQIWDQRLCIEPNWEEKAAKERINKGLKASILRTEEGAEGLRLGTKPLTGTMWDADPMNKRHIPDWIRMPVMGMVGDNIYHTGFITGIFDKEGAQIFEDEVYAKLYQKYNALREKTRNINIVFVIDGTQEMSPYITPVVNAFNAALNVFENSENNYKTGAVFYGLSGSGEVKKKDLNDDHESTISFLSENTVMGTGNNQAKDLYAGVDKALRMLNERETNFIVLIGDTGDDINKSNAGIISKMKTMECGLLAYQTRNVTAEVVYDDFINQCRELIEKPIPAVNKYNRPRLKRMPNKLFAYHLNYHYDSPIPGVLIHKDKDLAMSEAEFRDEMISMVKRVEEQQADLLEHLERQLRATGKPLYKLTPGMIKFLNDMNLSDEMLDGIKAGNYQLFVEGYTSVNVVNMEHPLFKHVLFLTEDELFSLYLMLSDITQAEGQSINELRENIYNAYKEVLIQHLGEREAREAIANKSADELISIVTGLPSSSPLLGKFRLPDLLSKRRVSDEEILNIRTYFEKKVKALKSIKGNNDHRFSSRDEHYYWIPQDFLP